MPDDIAYWQQEFGKLQAQLNELETDGIENSSLPLIAYLKARMGDIERHITALEKRRG